MNKKELSRHQSLLPGGVPKNIRLYDNGGIERGGSLDYLTCVFTGNYPGRNGMCFYAGFNGNPYHPQHGIYLRDESRQIIDYPKYHHLGKKITFDDLNPDCQRAIKTDYCTLWGLDPTYHG